MQKIFRYKAQLWAVGVLLGGIVLTSNSWAAEVAPSRPAEAGKRAVGEINNGLMTSDFPSTGLFFTGTGTCTATLIGCQTALTAAHCVCPGDAPCAPPPGGVVYFQHSGIYPVASVTVNPGWAPTLGLGREDLAILRLGAPVAGVQPARLNALGKPPAGTSVLLAGFGTTSTTPDGIKRAGVAVLSNCQTPNPLALCYDFLAPIGEPGADSTACPGDSGGPMFAAASDSSLLLVGATSGGEGPGFEDCTAPVQGVFSDLFAARAWIESQAGGDLGQVACGGLPSAGTLSAPWHFAHDALSPGRTEETYTIEVPVGTQRLHVTLNAEDYFFTDFDLFVRRGAAPTPSAFDCKSDAEGTLEICSIANPLPGTWHLQARRFDGSGPFQLTATTFLQQQGPCSPDAETACLQGGRFEVKVSWNNASASGTAKVMSFGGQRTENNDSVFYSFQSPTNFEMGVKMLNACIPLFGNKFWVFVSGLTDQGWQVVVRDTVTGASKTYSNTNGNLSQTFADTSAFDC